MRNIKYYFSKPIVLLTIIVIASFIVRLYKLDNPIADWHSWRQADTASVTKTYYERGVNLLFPRYHDISSIQTGMSNPKGLRMVEFPFYNLIHLATARTINFITFEEAGRMASIFVSLVSVVLIYLLGKELLGHTGGLLAAFFYGFLPFNIYFTRVILPDPLAVVFMLSGLYLFLLYERKKNNWIFILSALLFSFSMLIKPFCIFFLAPVVYTIFTDNGKITFTAKRVIGFLAFFLIVTLPFFLWRMWINQYPEGIPFFNWVFNGNQIRFHPSWFRWIFVERIGKMILGIWGVLIFLPGIVGIKKNNYFIQLFLAGMFLYLSIVASGNVMHDYYQILIIPVISLTLANGVIHLNEVYKNHKIIIRTVVLLLVILSFYFGWERIKDNYLIIHPEIIEAGQAVDRLTPKDALVIAPYNGDTAFLYQTNRWGWPAIDDSFDNIIKKGADYYVTVDINSTDSKYILDNYQIIEKTDNYFITDLNKKI